ncbi:MAG TPA: response regulator [Pirellulales bacterium]|nr:response regulator [Pirellulales bacterium]
MPTVARVCVVDDDAPVRTLACRILEGHGYAVTGYKSADDLLRDFNDAEIDCIVTDLKMPAVDGLEFQRRLAQLGSVVSLVVLTAYADVRTTVRLMQEGAISLLEKPYNPAELVEAVAGAVSKTQARRRERDKVRIAHDRVAKLTPEERKVMKCIVDGSPNKAIALRLDMSMRTVDRRRQSVLYKMAVNSVSELAKLVAKIDLDQE